MDRGAWGGGGGRLKKVLWRGGWCVGGRMGLVVVVGGWGMVEGVGVWMEGGRVGGIGGGASFGALVIAGIAGILCIGDGGPQYSWRGAFLRGEKRLPELPVGGWWVMRFSGVSLCWRRLCGCLCADAGERLFSRTSIQQGVRMRKGDAGRWRGRWKKAVVGLLRLAI